MATSPRVGALLPHEIPKLNVFIAKIRSTKQSRVAMCRHRAKEREFSRENVFVSIAQLVNMRRAAVKARSLAKTAKREITPQYVRHQLKWD